MAEAYSEEEQEDAPLDWLQQAVASNNICDLLDADKLMRIGQRVKDETMLDKGSRGDWDNRTKDAMDLALQVRENKTFPWPNAANVKFPLMTTAAIQFNARAYPAVVPGKDIVKGKVNGDDSGMFRPMTTPGGQLLMGPDGQPQVETVVAAGAKQERADRVARHMSWQLGEEMEEWEPDMDRLLVVLPIIGVVFRKTYFDPSKGRNCSQMVLPQNLFVDYEATCLEEAPRITQEFTLYPYQITERMRAGIYREFEYMTKSEDDQKPQTFYEQHRLLDLDEDGYPEPYVVTIHEDTGEVCRIVARFYKEDIEANEQGEVIKITPIHYFTKYGFIPNPESAIYDLGFGTLLNPVNESVNTILNQMLDAGTLQNAGGGFYGRGLRIKGGPLRFRPGEYKPVDVAGNVIRDNLFQFQHQGPSVVLFQLLGLLIDAGKEIASIKDVLTGEATGANASPTTTIAMIEQGMKAFTAIFKRVHRSLKSELKKIYKLNSIYLPQEAYFNLLDEQEAVAQKDYQTDDYDIQPVSDPTVVTDMQKMAKAQALREWAADPFVNPMEVRRRYFESIGIENIDSLLQQPRQGPDPKDQMKAMELELKAIEKQSKLPAEITELLTRAMKNVAAAEAQEAGIQLDSYRALIEAMTSAYQQGTVPGMAGQSGNRPVQAIS